MRSGPRSTRRADPALFGQLLGASTLLLIAAAHVLYFFPRVVDDMFIFLRYAEQIAAGNGAVYNTGERVEGFSSPLWTALLALGAWIGPGGVAWAKAWGAASHFALLAGVYRFGRDVVALSRPAAWAATLGVALNSYVVSWAVMGLETPLYLALLVASALFAERVARDGSARATAALAVAGAGLSLARPEGIFFLALIGGAAWFRARPSVGSHQLFQRAWRPALFAVGAWTAYAVFRHTYFGLWLPHTHYAKQGQGLHPSHLLALVGEGAAPSEIALFAFGTGASVWLAVRRITAVPLAVVLGALFFASAVMLDWMPNVRHFLPIEVFLPIVSVAAIEVAIRRRVLAWGVFAALGVLILVSAHLYLASLDARYSPIEFDLKGRTTWVRFKSRDALSDTLACLRRDRPHHVDAMHAFHHGQIAQLYMLLEADARPLAETWFVGRDIGIVGWLAPVQIFDTEGLFTPAVVRSDAWQRDRSVDRALIEETFQRPVAMTELFDAWIPAAQQDAAIRSRFVPPPYGFAGQHLAARDRRLPNPSEILRRYEQALAKMPRSFYVMTLYGEAVGAALSRRVETVRQAVRDHETAQVSVVPGDLRGGPISLDAGIDLIGCDFASAAVRAGGIAQLRCFFRARARLTEDYAVFVHVDAENGTRINADHAPIGGFLPTSRWPVGGIVRDVVSFRAPESPGVATAYVGLFVGDHRARATTLDGALLPPSLVDPDGRAIGPRLSITR